MSYQTSTMLFNSNHSSFSFLKVLSLIIFVIKKKPVMIPRLWFDVTVWKSGPQTFIVTQVQCQGQIRSCYNVILFKCWISDFKGECMVQFFRSKIYKTEILRACELKFRPQRCDSVCQISWNAVKFPQKMCFPILLCRAEFPKFPEIMKFPEKSHLWDNDFNFKFLAKSV